MAAVRRLSNSSLLIEAIKPRRLSNVAGLRGVLAPDLEHTTPKSMSATTPQSISLEHFLSAATPKSSCCTPKTPSAAENFLSAALASTPNCTPKASSAAAHDACGSVAFKPDEMATFTSLGAMLGDTIGYPRLLGMTFPMTAADEASKRVVTFEDEAHNLAEETRKAFLAMRERKQGRFVNRGPAKAEDHVASDSLAMMTKAAATHPRLLGCPPASTMLSVPPTPAAASNADAITLAQDAHASFLAMQQRRSGRNIAPRRQTTDKPTCWN